MNGKPKNAWDVYISTETSTDSYNLLQLIGNDSYKMGHFYYAIKAFEALEKIDSENDYEDALRGSVLGVFQMVVAGKESVEHLIEAAAILKSTESSPQVSKYLFRMTELSRLSRSGAKRTTWTSTRSASDIHNLIIISFRQFIV